jgi:small subunit ribosomal protein S6
MLKQYETVFIATPVLSDAQMKEAVDKFKKVLTDNEATIVNNEDWGLRKLAYNIQKKSTGFYTLIEFDAEPTIVNKLETAYRRDEKVLRYLIVKMEKYAAEYAAKRRSNKQPKQEA